MRKEKEAHVPHMNGLTIFSGQTPCLIPAMRRKEGGTQMSSLQMVVADNQNRQPCGDELGQCGTMVGHPNIENKRRLMSMERRLVDVDDIVGDLAKAVDGLANFCVMFLTWLV
jgi:hypothetical protein